MVNAALSPAGLNGAMRIAGIVPLLAALLVCQPARGDILDIQAEPTPSGLRLLFVFDSQPADASIETAGSEAQAVIAGVRSPDRLLRPADGALRQISVASRPLGLSLGLAAARPILAAEASVFSNSVLFELTLAPGPEDSRPEDSMVQAAIQPPPEAEAPEGPVPLAPEPPQQAEAGTETETEAESAPEATDIADAAEPAAPDETLTAALADQLRAAADAAMEDAETAANAARSSEADETEAAPETAAADAARADTGWTGDPDPGPPQTVRRAPPGAAAELLAAPLDRAACAAAAETVRADPWEIDALYNHGACLARDGQPERAREIFERLTTFDPDAARALAGLGVLRQDAGDRDGAQAYYERAMAASPGDGLATLIRLLRDL